MRLIAGIKEKSVAVEALSTDFLFRIGFPFS